MKQRNDNKRPGHDYSPDAIERSPEGNRALVGQKSQPRLAIEDQRQPQKVDQKRNKSIAQEESKVYNAAKQDRSNSSQPSFQDRRSSQPKEFDSQKDAAQKDKLHGKKMDKEKHENGLEQESDGEKKDKKEKKEKKAKKDKKEKKEKKEKD